MSGFGNVDYSARLSLLIETLFPRTQPVERIDGLIFIAVEYPIARLGVLVEEAANSFALPPYRFISTGEVRGFQAGYQYAAINGLLQAYLRRPGSEFFGSY
jgi:hypothetical protein